MSAANAQASSSAMAHVAWSRQAAVAVVVNLSAFGRTVRLGAADRSLPAHGWLIESA